MQTIMKIRLLFLIGFCFMLLAMPGSAQTFKFQTTETNVLKTAAQVKAHGFPDTLTVRNYNWFYTTANPATWGNIVKFKSNHSIVKFSVNQAYPKKVYADYGYQLIFRVFGYSNPADTTAVTSFNDTLTIHYNPDSLSAYQDIQIKKYSAYHKVMVILDDILDITDPNAIVSVNLATINLNFNIEAMKLTQLYDKGYYGYNHQLYASHTTPAVANDLLDVKWCLNGSCTSPTRVTPCSYELEWTYIDNFAADGSDIAAGNLNYDFRHNSTRIWLDTNYFQIPITYARGYVAYRVRMVRPDSVEFRYPMYSKWTELDDAGVLTSMSSGHYYEISNSHISDSLNWQYTISFAEQGKYKHVLSYFDGLLKNRQSITRFNSQANRLIATSSIFDFEGRPAIQVLPTPINSSKFKYQYGMTTNANTLLPYRAGNFDTLYGYVCPTENLIAPLDSLALPSLYYSHLNGDTSNFQKYVPHAEGYPMVHTKFEPGYADRVQKQGGAGLPLQLGNGHVMHNDYLNGEQTDLNILFGVNAGYEGFYRKTVSRDPNGQLSLMIGDYEGKQVASTLIGNGPDQNAHAIEDMDSIISPSYYSYDLMNGTPQQITANKRILDKMYYMDVAGMDTVRYQYTFTPYNTGCDSLYLSVKANYNFYVADECGDKKIDKSAVLGNTGLVFSPSSTTFPEVVEIANLDQGKQFLHKELVFNSDDVYAAVDSFMVFPDNCLHDEPWFIKNAVLEREFPCPIDSLLPCEQLKYKMMQELYPGAKYGKYFINPNDIVVDTTNNSIFSNLCDTVVSHNLNYYIGGDTTYYPGSNSVGAWQDVDTTAGLGAGEGGGAIGVGGVDTVFLFGNYVVGYYGYGTGVGGGFGNDTSANCYDYRYQDTCLVHLPDSVTKNGIVYHNIWAVSADTFIYIFNDEIAEALLPLHPEYCKLNNCITDTFKEKYLDVPDYATAQKFDFDFLQSIIDQDPLVPVLTAAPFNFPDAEDSLATFGGVLHWRLDTFVMKQVYCGCSDTVMAKKCIEQQFNHEIFNNLLVNDYLRGQYFKLLRDMYLQNRERYITMVTGYGSDSTCGPCNLVRMKLIPSPIFPTGVTNNGGINQNLLDSLSPGMQNIWNNANDMDASEIAIVQDSANWYMNYADSLLCFGQIDSIIQRLSNCNNANPTTLNDIRTYLEDLCTNALVPNGNYSPQQIHAAIVSSGATLDEYCNPYMVNYDILNPMFSNVYQQCKGIDFYSDVHAFLSRPEVSLVLKNATSNPSTLQICSLNNANQFENKISLLLNTPDVGIEAYYHNFQNLYTICIFEQSPGASPMDTVKIYLKNPMNGAGPCTGLFNSLPGGSTITFNSVNCTSNMFPGTGSVGYINSFSFGIDVSVYNGATTLTTQCKLIGWSDSVETMKPNSGDMAECVPCTQMRELFNEFNDTLGIYGILGADHPCYDQMLRSFMNGKLSRMFATDDYLRFIGSCALADYNPFKYYLAYSSITFSGGNYVNSFLSGLNTLDPDIYLYPFLQYKSGTSDTTLLFSYAGVPLSKLHMVRSYFSGYAFGTKLHNTIYNPPASATFMGLLLKSTSDTSTISAPVIPCTFTYSSPTTVQVFNGVTYQPHYLYYVSIPASPTPEDINTEIAQLDKFIYDSNKNFMFYPSHLTTVGADYYVTEKQDFLSYIYQSMGQTVPVVLDTIREQLLTTEIASYSGKNVSYKLPFSPFVPEHLYITDGSSINAKFTQKLEHILDTLSAYNYTNDSYESPFFFEVSSPQHRPVTTMSPSRKLDAYLCGDGSYWIRYFGAGDTLYNLYMRMPKYITRAEHKNYKVIDVTLLPGNNTSRYFSVSLENVNDATKNLSIQGIADYVIGSTLVLENVLLSNSMEGKEVPVIDTFDNCERQKLTAAIFEGKVKYQLYIDSVRAALYVALLGHLTNSAQETMSHGYKDQRFLFTLYYYDRAGNLMRTVPPEGLNKLEFSQTMMDDVDNARGSKTSPAGTLPAHEKISYYDYNSINKIFRQQSPDGGETKFFYDNLGRLIFSQNAKQLPNGFYTYTLYDKQSRIIETGQSKLGCTYFEPYPYSYLSSTLGTTVVNAPPSNNSCYYIDYASNLYVPYPPILYNFTGMDHESIITTIRATNRTDVVFTVYDTIATDLTLIDGLSEQTNLRKRISCVKFFESIGGIYNNNNFKNYTHATHYSYDIAGNVNYLVQDFPYFDYLSQRYKRVDYDYDVISGKVNLVSYNRSFADQYYHRYSYDSDNRVTKVETSADAYLWKQDASYQYYQHGPLARAEIGDLRVQGIDFAYTVQGWLKAINGDTLAGGMDMGEDGNVASIFPRDPAGLVLDYFAEDYKSISGRKISNAKEQSKSMYNGNIARQTTAMQPFLTLCKQYVYDQLNRIKRTDYAKLNVAQDSLYQIGEYRNTYNYDDDGNLLKLTRMGGMLGTSNGVMMDTFTYHYYTGNNQLRNVTDLAADAYDNDIKYFATDATNRFRYDATGNIIKDLVSSQDTIEWNLYNKVTHTRNNTGNNDLDFVYDGAGNRVAKHFTQSSDTNMIKNTDYYVRDAQGNILAVYNNKQLIEQESLLLTISHCNDLLHTNLGTPDYLQDFATYAFGPDPDFSAFIVNNLMANQGLYAAYLNYDPSYYMLRNNTIVENMLLGGHQYIRPLAIYDTLQISNALKGMYANNNQALQEQLLVAIYNAPADTLEYLLGKLNDTLLTNICTLLAIDTSSDTLALLTNRIGEVTNYINEIYDSNAYSVNLWMHALGRDSVFTSYGGFIPVIQNTLYAYRNDTTLGDFFDYWSATSSGIGHYNATAGKLARFFTVYNDSTYDVLTEIYNQQDMPVIDSAIATTESAKNIQSYLKIKIGGGVNLSVQDYVAAATYPQWFVDVIKSEHFNLAEHHLYGSSRLGIKSYWPNQLYATWDYTDTSAFIIDTALLTGRQPWYSAQYQDGIKPDALQPWSSTFTNTSRMQTILGQKQYEQTDHLGNVVITSSDRKYALADISDSVITGYHAELPSTYDYYPFGMLMPGRYTSDTSTQCATVSHTVMVPTIVTYNDLLTSALPYNISATALSNVTANTIDVATLGVNKGISLSLIHAELLKDNSFEFEVYRINRGQYYIAEIYEYNISDTVLLASEVVDRDAVYTLEFKPTGSGVVGLLLKTTNSATSTSTIKMKNFKTTVTTYTAQSITTTICNNGGDRYRFGFNGMEKDNEVKGIGNSLDFGARMYDSRLGRWLSLDPLAQKYPNMSPYIFVGNLVTKFIDPDGRKIELYDLSGKKVATITNGKMVIEKGFENSPIIQSYTEAKNYLSSYTDLFAVLEDSKKVLKIQQTESAASGGGEFKSVPVSFLDKNANQTLDNDEVSSVQNNSNNIGSITWNPDGDYTDPENNIHSSYLILAHELSHARSFLSSIVKFFTRNRTTRGGGLTNDEEVHAIKETNEISKKLDNGDGGRGTRIKHGGSGGFVRNKNGNFIKRFRNSLRELPKAIIDKVSNKGSTGSGQRKHNTSTGSYLPNNDKKY